MIRGVTIQIDEPHKIFVAGDVLSGYVSLNTEIPVTRVVVDLICAEACHGKQTHRSEQIVYVHYRQTTEALKTTDNGKRSRGNLPFKFVLSDKVDECPPQSYEPVLSGVTWCISVFIGTTNTKYKCTVEKPLLACSSYVSVYPRVSSAVLSLLPMRLNGERRFDKMTIVLIDAPRFLPQKCNHFTLKMMLVPYEPVFVNLVEVSLEKTIVHNYLGAQERYCRETYLSTLDVFSMVNQSLNLDVNNCHLTHQEPGAFKSLHVEITYSLVVRVLSTYSVIARWLIDVVPPSVSRIADADYSSHIDGEPPAYSESPTCA